MEPAGRYFWADLRAFLRPAFKDWRTSIRTLWRSSTFLVCALPLGIGFAIAAFRHRRKNK